MKKSLSNVTTVFSSMKKRSNSFYLLAFIPLLLISYFYAQYPLGLTVPLYGFILLLMKKHKLFSRPEAPVAQKLLGLAVVFTSFFVYFFISPFLPETSFYGLANYFVYIIGLFLVFFEIHTLKEAFSPLFLVGAFVSSSIISSRAESLFTPYLPSFTSFIVNTLRATGMAVTQSLSYPNVIFLFTSKGTASLRFVWACVGFISTYIFSIIVVIILSEEPCNIKTKIIWSIIGVSGIFTLNILRIVTLVAGYYFYGYKYGQIIHSYIGYILFIAWSMVFLYLFSKRNTISLKIRHFHAKILKRGAPSPP